MAVLTPRMGALRAAWTGALLACVASAKAEEPKAAEPSAAAPAVAAEPVDYGLAAAIDPLDRARAVEKLGDARVLALLAVRRGEHGAVADAERVLAAVHSARWLADPAPAVPILIELMQGRDPDLAPASAQALVDVARGFVEGKRVPESLTTEQLSAWAAALAPIEESPRTRADLRLAATEARALLHAARERL